MGENSLRALASDLAYLEAWALAATGAPLAWPAAEALALKFVAHHLWDPGPARGRFRPRHASRGHGGADRRRRLARRRSARALDRPAPPRQLGTLHRWRGLDGPFAAPPCAPRSASPCAPARGRAGAKASAPSPATSSIGCCRRATPTGSPIAAIAPCCWSPSRSGGRRRSEIAGLRVEQLRDEPPVAFDPADSELPAPALPHNPSRPHQDAPRPTTTPAPADRSAGRRRKLWLERADIAKGPIFRAIDRWGAIEERALTPQAVNLIVKRRCALAGFGPREFSAHGLRSGYLTEAARRGVSLPEAMQQSQHRSVQQAAQLLQRRRTASRQGRASDGVSIR